MARRTSAAKQLAQLAERFEPVIRDAFLAAIDDITNRAVLGEIVTAIQDGDINRAIASLGLDDAAFRPLVAAVEQAFETGGVTTAGTFPRVVERQGVRTAFRFDVRNSRAEAFLRDWSSEKVTAIAEDTRAVVRTTIQRGMVDGRNPRSTALDLVGRVDRKTGKCVGGVIGLTPQQESWVANARRDLNALNDLVGGPLDKIKANPYFTRKRRLSSGDKVIIRKLMGGKPIDADTIEKLLTNYKSSLLQYRGEVIGRTEAIAALNQSEHEAINQAVEQGTVKASQVKRVWDSAGNDGRTRESHLLMEGQTVGLNEPFTFPDGSKAMFPGDRSLGAPADETIQCRCVARTVIDWLADAKDAISADDRAALLALSDNELFGGRG